MVTKDDLIASVWGGRIVSESTLTSRITAARKAIGDTGERQDLIRTMSRKGLRFVGKIRDGMAQAPKASAAASAGRPQPDSEPTRPPLRQEIHFCTAPDGVRIAYAEVGEGPPLVKTANWLNHLEYDWKSPIWSHLLRDLATRNRLIRYDARGMGCPTGTYRIFRSMHLCATSRPWSRRTGYGNSRCWGFHRAARLRSRTRYAIRSGSAVLSCTAATHADGASAARNAKSSSGMQSLP